MRWLTYFLCAVLAAGCAGPQAADVAPAPRNVLPEELVGSASWDLFRADERYWIMVLSASALECADCDFSEGGDLKICRECRPGEVETALAKRALVLPKEERFFEIVPDYDMQPAWLRTVRGGGESGRDECRPEAGERQAGPAYQTAVQPSGTRLQRSP